MIKSIVVAIILVSSLIAGEYNIPALTVGGIVSEINPIGDFDGDGYDELMVVSYESGSSTTYSAGIYSAEKKTYLLRFDDSMYGNDIEIISYANLTSSPGVELIYQKKIYTYSGTVTSSSAK